MVKFVSTVPQSRFDTFKVDLPAEWDKAFIDYPCTDEALIKACQDADVLLVGSMHKVSEAVVRNSPSLRMIHTEGVGFDKVAVDAAADIGLPVCNNRAVNNTSVAEHTVALMLAALKQVVYANSKITAENYEEIQGQLRSEGVHELGSQHVGLVGGGAIGREVARLLGVFGCKISYYDVFRLKPEQERELNLNFVSLEDLLQQCDVISLHVPVLPDTLNMINEQTIGLIQKSAILINTSRGELIDQAAMASALENGAIKVLAVDTISPEPPKADHPFMTLSESAKDRLILTPHLAGTTSEAFTRMLQWVIKDTEDVMAGKLPSRVCNKVTKLRQ